MIDISKLNLPLVQTIRAAWQKLPEDERNTLLNKLSEQEFISHRVNIYLEQLQQAMHAGLSEQAAKEIAITEAMRGLSRQS